jgi:hypothetical protein
MDSVQTKIRSRVVSKGRGSVFTPKDFLDLGSRDAIDQAICRLAQDRFIQRVGRGLYHYPRKSDRLGIDMPAGIDDLAQAIGRQTGSRVTSSGAVAANRLGLSSQVPAMPLYLSDGRTRKVRVGNTTIQLKRVSPKRLPQGRAMSAVVFQALHFLGKDAIDNAVILAIRKRLSPSQRQHLLQDARYATGWIADVARQVADQSKGGNWGHPPIETS